MSQLARQEANGLVTRYRNNHRTAQRSPWRSGPFNSIDRAIDEGMNAAEIAHELDVPKWVVIERFAARSRE